MHYNHLEYLLNFKGYDESHNQWEVHTHVHAEPKIVLFHRKYPSAADTPQAPSPRVDQSRPKRSDVYRSSTQNADATTLRTLKVDDILLSILTIATPGDRGLSHP
jgi:hypothetical protein